MAERRSSVAIYQQFAGQVKFAIKLAKRPKRISSLKAHAAKASLGAGKLEKAKAYSEELLEEAGDTGPDAIHYGNTVLGRLALQGGDLPQAKEHLLESGRVSASPVLGSFGPSMVLANELLEKGETEVVLEYFDLCEKFWKHQPERLEAWKKAVKAGSKPDFGPNLSR